MHETLKSIKKHKFLWAFVCFYILLSFATYKHYPIANGEEFRYFRAKETVEHYKAGQFKENLIQPVPNYFIYNLYTVFLVLLNPNFYFEWFHLLNLLFGTLLFVFTYFLTYRSTNSLNFSIFSVLFLFCIPRFSSQIAFNPIDMPFAVLFLGSLYLITEYSEKPVNHWSTLLMGVCFGFTQGLRQLGFMVYMLLFLANAFKYKKQITPSSLVTVFKNNLYRYFYIFILANLFMIATWPNFAINVFKGYWWYFFVGSNFYLWDYGLLFGGEFLTNAQRPPYYLPFFQAITYPIFVLVTAVFGIKYYKDIVVNNTAKLVVSSIFITYILYFLLNPVLYDGIRHFYFIIPLFVIFGTTGLQAFNNSTITPFFKKFVVGVLIFFMLKSLYYQVKEFPYGYYYFNEFTLLLNNPYKNYESDYSNTKYKEAVEWVLENEAELKTLNNVDKTNKLKVFPCDNNLAVDYFSKKRFVTLIDSEDADIIICDYRNKLKRAYDFEIISEFGIGDKHHLYILNPD